MALYKDLSNNYQTILIWKYEESDELNAQALIDENDKSKVENYHPKKRIEYLMVRQMLKNKFPNHRIFYKHIGEPYLVPNDFCISISHSFPYAAICVSENRVGIDIEKTNPKILKIKHKFLHENELKWTDNEDELEFLTIIWVIKEALYKLHPSKYSSLKKNYEVKPFNLKNLSEIICRVFDDDFEEYFSAKVIKIEEYYFGVII